MLNVTCEHCGAVLKIPEQDLGKTSTCNYCGERIVVAVQPLKFSYEAIEADREKEWEAPQHKRCGALREMISKAGEVAGKVARKVARKGAEIGGQLQRTLGEDYYAILENNPLVLDTLSRSGLLVENKELLSTAFNVPWTSALLWSAAAGSAITLQRPMAQVVGELFHYGPGHIKRWGDINKFMDTARGVGHRLKFGHSIDYLPQIVEKFGIEGVPAYFMHLLQDFTTVDGIPAVPRAWDFKASLQLANVPRKVATGLVAISFSSMLGALAVITLGTELWKFGGALAKKGKTPNYLKTADTAFHKQDYIAAAENYQRALKIERSPYVLMALGQVYMQRAKTRFRANRAFLEAVDLFSSSP